MSAIIEESSVDPSEAFQVYWKETQRPLVSIAFLTPLLLVYEIGVAFNLSTVSRNGADLLLRGVLFSDNADKAWLLPILIVGILLLWHHLTGDHWRFEYSTLGGMACESLGIAILLLASAQLLNGLFLGNEVAPDVPTQLQAASQAAPPDSIASDSLWSRGLSYLGAGIYEELVFRLLLISPLVLIANKLMRSEYKAATFVIAGSCLLFAAAHYQPLNSAGEAMAMTSAEFWYSFSFRALAGAVFGVVFLKRGFGVVVGAHAAYDLMTLAI